MKRDFQCLICFLDSARACVIILLPENHGVK
jgi:hypothetical protein